MKRKFLSSFFTLCFLLFTINTIAAKSTKESLALEAQTLTTQHPDIYLTGSATTSGWTNTNPQKMVYIDGKYVWEGHLKAGGEFKVLTQLGNWNKCYNASITGKPINSRVNYKLVYNAAGHNDFKFVVQKSGNYIINIDIDNKTLYIKEKNKIRVLCVGNSITEGYGLSSKYPETLGKYLGDNYSVFNLGKGGRTMLKKGDYPYLNESYYSDLKESEADIIILKLGTNDSKPINWGKYHDNFHADMISMIDELSNLPSKPLIYIGVPCYVKPKLSEENSLQSTFETNIRGTVIRNYIVPTIRDVAKEKNLETIDFYELTNGWSNLYYDGVHPTNDGAILLAQYAYKVLTKQPVIVSTKNKIINSVVRGVKNKSTIKVKGNNLVGDLQVSVSGNGFSVLNSTIPKAAAESVDGFDLSVMCLPNTIDNVLSGKITITGGGISEKYEIDLKATVRDLYLIGSATPYNWQITMAPKMSISDDCITWSGMLKPGTLKFLTSKNTWFNNYYSTTPKAKVIGDGNTQYPIRFILDSDFTSTFDYQLVISEAGLYEIKIDLKTNNVTFLKFKIDDIWATGSALNYNTIKLDIDPMSTKTINIFRYIGTLNAGTIKFMTTETKESDTKYIIPNTLNANIESNAEVSLSKTDLGWIVTQASNAYRIKVGQSSIKTERVQEKKELYLVGTATPALFDINKAIKFEKDISNPYLFSLECNLKISKTSGNLLKILGQKSWFGYSLHPLVNNAIFEDFNYYKEYVAPANPDYLWNLDPSKEGLYKITVNTLDETVRAKYLGLQTRLLPTEINFNTNNQDIIVYEENGNVHISLPGTIKQTTSKLFSLDGKLLDSSTQTGTFTLGNNLSKGIYIVNIQFGTDSFNQKVSVK